MNWKTHLIGGAMVTEAVTVLAMHAAEEPIYFFPAAVAAGMLGGLVPDIDHRDSKITNSNIVTKGISKVVRSLTTHRGITHVPVFWGLIALLIYLICPKWLTTGFGGFCIWGFFIGIGSHLVLDTLNIAGVMWLWPLSTKHWAIAWIKTGGKAEDVVRIIIFILAIALAIFYIVDRIWLFI